MKYDAIIIDVFNLFHKLKKKEYEKDLINIKKNTADLPNIVYRKIALLFIDFVDNLIKKHATESSNIYLIYDPILKQKNKLLSISSNYKNNYRKNILKDYKKNRNYDTSTIFFNTINFLKYYYLNKSPQYKSIMIMNVEADDLIKPILCYENPQNALLVTNDSDCYRYIVNDKIHFLPSLDNEPKDITFVIEKLSFYPTENNVIIYKTLFGDKTDNIPQLLPDKLNNLLKEYLNEFKNITLNDLILESKINNNKKDNKYYDLYKEINKLEKEININNQLVKEIFISKEQFYASLCIGKNLTKITDLLYFLINNYDNKEFLNNEKEFKFGNVNINEIQFYQQLTVNEKEKKKKII